MPGINTTGLPNTEDYNLGRGIVYFAPLSSVIDSLNLPLGYRDLGNAPEFSISLETETLEHQSSRSGLKVTDKEVVISQKITLALTLDEINFQNLAVLLSGDAAQTTPTNPAIAGITIILNWIGSVVLGEWYDMTNATLPTPGDATSVPSGDRAYDVDLDDETLAINGGAALIRDVPGTPGDYTIDAEMGRIFFLTNPVGALVDGDGIDFTLDPKALARELDEVQSLTKTAVLGALKFIAENPASSDKQTEYQFHKVSLKAEGDFSLIGDEFTQMQFTAVAERNEQADPDSATLTVRTIQAT